MSTTFSKRVLSRAGSLGLALTTATGALVIAAQPAAAVTPAAATGIHVSSATSTSFTVSMRAAARAQYYRVFASTTKSNVYVVNIARAHASGLSKSPTVTLSGLPFSSATWIYRVETLNGKSRAWSGYYTVGLRPAAPKSVAVRSSKAGTYLTWASGASTGSVISMGTNAALTQNRRDFTIRGTTHTFTPYGMTSGRTYYFRVRARTVATNSPFSALVSTVVRSRSQGVRVMTYNVLEHAYDGSSSGGQIIAPWSKRQPVAASLIRETRPDVVAIEEAESWLTGKRGPRQVDGLVGAVGKPYRVARTEVPPTEAKYFRAGGNYIIYNTATFAETGHAGHWLLPYGKYAAYAILRSRATGASFLFTATHTSAGNGRSYDSQRQNQLSSLMSKVSSYRSSHGNIPVIYAGDWNSTSSKSHAFDGVAVAAAQGSLQNTRNISQSVINGQYNSANQYMRTAAVGGFQIDKIYAPAGVAASSWKEILHLRHGKFVGVMGSDHNPVFSAMSYPY